MCTLALCMEYTDPYIPEVAWHTLINPTFQDHTLLFFLYVIAILNPLDTPHHMRANESCEYREGVALNYGTKSCTLVDCGLSNVR